MEGLLVKDLEGRDVPFDTIGRDRPTLLVFVRHFG
jgi:hypothetical protein